MSERLREHFPTLYIFHGLTDNYNRYCVWYASLTSKSPLVIEVPELGQAEFEAHQLVLSLSGMFYAPDAGI